MPEWLAQLDPVIAPAVQSAEALSAREYLGRIARLRGLARSAAPRLDAVDVIASPTLCLTPPLMSEVANTESHLRVNRRIVRNTVAVNYLGLCAITMPVGLRLIAPASGGAAADDRSRGGARARHAVPVRGVRRGEREIRRQRGNGLSATVSELTELCWFRAFATMRLATCVCSESSVFAVQIGGVEARINRTCATSAVGFTRPHAGGTAR